MYNTKLKNKILSTLQERKRQQYINGELKSFRCQANESVLSVVFDYMQNIFTCSSSSRVLSSSFSIFTFLFEETMRSSIVGAVVNLYQ